jgi:hypothetical protein
MISMERINIGDTANISYRGLLRTNEEEITAEASVPVPRDTDQSSHDRQRRQCIRAVINKLLRRYKKMRVRELTERRQAEETSDNSGVDEVNAARYIYEIHQTRPFSTNAERSALMTRWLQEIMASYHNGDHQVFYDSHFANEFRAKRDTPERRAMALLARKIGKIKYRSLEKNGWFEEHGRYGTYRFHKMDAGGVTFIQQIKVGGLKARPVMWDLCVQSQSPDMPKGDVILSRWLVMKADEDKFLETANFRNIHTVDESTRITLGADIPVIYGQIDELIHDRQS